jgi:hypothetical protein
LRKLDRSIAGLCRAVEVMTISVVSRVDVAIQ